jgi:hypothetical protein
VGLFGASSIAVGSCFLSNRSRECSSFLNCELFLGAMLRDLAALPGWPNAHSLSRQVRVCAHSWLVCIAPFSAGLRHGRLRRPRAAAMVASEPTAGHRCP